MKDQSYEAVRNEFICCGQIERRSVGRLTAYARNVRTHPRSQIDQIAASIQAFGFVNPILIGPDDVIIAGHARLQAARQAGLNEVPVIMLAHLSTAQRRALVIADNQLAMNAGWDEELLRAELAALVKDDIDVELLGFDDGELARLLAAEEEPATALRDPERIPAPRQRTVTVPGDLWRLGDHRMLCADPTGTAAIQTVLGDGFADMVFTDPGAIESDENAKRQIPFDDLLQSACSQILAVCRGAIYVCISPSESHMLYRAFLDAGGHCSGFIVWWTQRAMVLPS